MNDSDAKIREYDDGCLWYMDDGDLVTIGVTEKTFASVGNVNALDIVEMGDEYTKGDWIGELFGTNGSFEIVAPMAIRIIETNQEVLDQPSIVEDDPTGDAWLLRAEKVHDEEE